MLDAEPFGPAIAMPRLYHFTSARYALEDVAQQQIKISRIADLNDPFELLPANLKDRGRRKLLRDFKASFESDHGVLCFSRKWDNPVLWSHYAEKHFGICLGFDVDERCALSVSYVDAMQDLDVAKFDVTRHPRADFARDEIRMLATTKFRHWQYEDEMRVFVALDHSTAQNELYFYSFSSQLALREVIIGARCNVPIKVICDAVRQHASSVMVRKARLAFSSFSVTEDLRFRRRIDQLMSSDHNLTQ